MEEGEGRAWLARQIELSDADVADTQKLLSQWQHAGDAKDAEEMCAHLERKLALQQVKSAVLRSRLERADEDRASVAQGAGNGTAAAASASPKAQVDLLELFGASAGIADDAVAQPLQPDGETKSAEGRGGGLNGVKGNPQSGPVDKSVAVGVVAVTAPAGGIGIGLGPGPEWKGVYIRDLPADHPFRVKEGVHVGMMLFRLDGQDMRDMAFSAAMAVLRASNASNKPRRFEWCEVSGETKMAQGLEAFRTEENRMANRIVRFFRKISKASTASTAGARSKVRSKGVAIAQAAEQPLASPRCTATVSPAEVAQLLQQREQETLLLRQQSGSSVSAASAKSAAVARPAAAAAAAEGGATALVEEFERQLEQQRNLISEQRKQLLLFSGECAAWRQRHYIQGALIKMRQGSMMAKFAFNTKKVYARFLQLEPHDHFVRWGPAKGNYPSKSRLELGDILSVHFGPRTRIFMERMDSLSKPPWRCFSIRTRERTFDFVSPDQDTTMAWVLGVQSLAPRIENKSHYTVGKILLKRASMRLMYSAKLKGVRPSQLFVRSLHPQPWKGWQDAGCLPGTDLDA